MTAYMEDGFIGSKFFHLNAPGGCSKTYPLYGILGHVKGMRQKGIATASSGIAATLFNGDRTVQSFYGIPGPILNASTCNVMLNINKRIQIYNMR